MLISAQNLKPVILSIAILFAIALQCTQAKAAGTETAILAGGCFWCVEADFESVKGVKSAVSGYTGGSTANPTYKKVTKGGTGHYEAVKIRFDPDIVSYEKIVTLFLRSIDPLDAGGQFCDRGASYRTAIFVSDAGQKAIAERVKAEAEAALGKRIVTPILPAKTFYNAEDYHQDYYKGSKTVLTRFGPKKQASAYKAYRKACGRDARIRQIWGNAAAF